MISIHQTRGHGDAETRGIPAMRSAMRELYDLLGTNAEPALTEGHKGNEGPEPLEDFKKRAAAAFERDMRPVCNAIAGALQDDDLKALQGLRALLPHLLSEVNRAPALADLLALQLGKTLLDGMKEEGK